MDTPGMTFIWRQARRDFVDRFSGSFLGLIWALVGPLVSLAIYIVVFGKVMGLRLPGSSNVHSYGIYVTAGLLPWIAFANSIHRSATVFLDRRALLSKIAIPLPFLPMAINLSETLSFLIPQFLFIGFLLATGHGLEADLFLLLFVYYLQQVLAFGIGLLAATLTVFIQDLKEIVGILLQVWFWFTPIVYVREILPDSIKGILVYNPASVFIESYHRVFVFREALPFGSLILLAIFAHGIGLLAWWGAKRMERDVRDFL